MREEVGLEHVVMMGSGDAPHDADYEELLAAATPAIPDEPEEDDPVILMYTGGTTGTPKGVLLDQRAELLNLYHVVDGVADRRRRGLPAPDADVPRGVDGRHRRCARARWHVGDRAAVRSGRA